MISLLGALSAWKRGSDFTPVWGTKWGKREVQEHERKAGKWERKIRNKQMQQMEGTGIAGQKDK